jgi:hypothetical protein
MPILDIALDNWYKTNLVDLLKKCLKKNWINLLQGVVPEIKVLLLDGAVHMIVCILEEKIQVAEIPAQVVLVLASQVIFQ